MAAEGSPNGITSWIATGRKGVSTHPHFIY